MMPFVLAKKVEANMWFLLVPFKEHKLTVPVETTQWPAGKAERIGINR